MADALGYDPLFKNIEKRDGSIRHFLKINFGFFYYYSLVNLFNEL